MKASGIIGRITASGLAAGVHCSIENDGENVYSVVTIRKIKDNFEIITSADGLKTLEDLGKICKNLPVILSLDGKGVIHKKTQAVNQDNIIDKLFPGVHAAQFNIQSATSGNNEIFASICRKEQQEQICALFTSGNILLYDLFLGPFAISCLFQDADIFTGKQRIRVKDDKVVGIEKNDSPVSEHEMCKIILSGNQIIAYSNAIHFFEHDSEIISDIDKEVFKNEFRYLKLYRTGIAATLVFLFLTLMVNFFIFNNYKDKHEFLEGQLMIKEGLSKKLEKLRSDFLTKQDLLNKSGMLQKTKISFYLDRIVQIMPEDIKLREFIYQPVNSKIKDKEEIIFEGKVIKIKGVSASAQPVNEWLKEIVKKEWVEKAGLENYFQEDYNIPGEFELNIAIKSE